MERKQKNLLGEVKEDISDTFIDMLPLLFPTFIKQSLKHSILALGQDFDDYYFVTLVKLANLRVLHSKLLKFSLLTTVQALQSNILLNDDCLLNTNIILISPNSF